MGRLLRRATARAGVVLGLCLLRCQAAVSGAPPAYRPLPTEWEVKAAYLYNFTRFVEWPATAFASPDAPFVIAVVGKDPFGDVLDRTLAGKAAVGRSVVVKRVPRATMAAQAQIAFLGDGEGTESAVEALRGRPVLTVSDGEGLAEKGVMLSFRIRDNRVRFEVNLRMAEAAGLRLSSQLLKLAVLVRGMP